MGTLYTFDAPDWADYATAAVAYAGVGVVMPSPWKVTCSLVEPGQMITSPTGGPAQRLGRLGARWRCSFASMPALGPQTARQLLALRLAARANGDTLAFLWPQPPFTGALGAPAVNGGGQLGTSLVANGFTAGATIPAATFFSVVYRGRNNLHCTTAAVTADSGGAATLPIAPMLRSSPASGAGLAFAAPAIEGFIQGHTEDWTLQMLAWVGLPAFDVVEAG